MELVSATDDDAVARATAALDGGNLVLLPLDLRYVVAADALDDEAVDRLFVATNRAADRALTVVVGGYEDLHHVAFGGAAARDLADAHWPGPSTLLLKPRPWLPDALLAGADEVRVTVPKNAFARDLARHFGPIAVARAGHESLDVEAARFALGGEARMAVDGGALPGGVAKVLRPGASAAP